MSLEQLGNIGEFVAAIAVVVSIFYLAVQMRQNTASVGWDQSALMPAGERRFVMPLKAVP
jgi:hypothetical protein